MALLSFRGISTPSLPAQGEQRRSSYFNIPRGNSPRYRPELPRNKWPNPDEQRRLIHCGSLSQVVPTNSAASIVEAVIARASVYVSVMTALGHVWTAPGWQELFSRFAALVGAAMCPAF